MRRALSNVEGGVAIIVAVSSAVLLIVAGLAVDIGYFYLQSRQLQGMADMAAIAAANDLPRAQAAADATVAANPFNAPVQAEVVTGVYKGVRGTPRAQRFKPGGASPNAARVVLHSEAEVFFARIFLDHSTVQLARTATASQANLASFSIGTRLAALQGGIANSLLSGLTGGSVSLSVMDYNALASADVDLFDYVGALKTEAHLQGVSFDDVLSAQVSKATALSALKSTLQAAGNGAAASAVGKVQAASDNAPVNLDNLLDLGPYSGQAEVNAPHGAGVSLSALDMTSAILSLANGGRQVELDLGATIPGVSSTKAWLAIGERPANSPWMTIADNGDVVVRTAQARLFVDAKVAPGAGLLSTAGVASVRVPILVELASAEAKLSAITCGPDKAAHKVDLLVKPSIGRVAVSDVDVNALKNFNATLPQVAATLIGLPLINVKASGQVQLGGVNWQAVNFTRADIDAKLKKTVSTNDVAQAALGPLFANTTITVKLLGLSILLGDGPVTAAVGALLTNVAPALDLVINSITDLLGVRLGQADVRVRGLRCGSPVLVS